MTQSPPPCAANLPPTHRCTLWTRPRPDRWDYQRTDCEGRLLTVAAEIERHCPGLEVLILPPGERPIMPTRGLCHRSVRPLEEFEHE